MLVLSRRLQEKLYFPGIGLILHVLSVRGGTVRLGIEAPPELTVLRGEMQASPVEGQLPDAETGEGGCDATVRGVGHALRVASDGLEIARLGLESWETRVVKEILDTVQDHLESLQRRLRRGRRIAVPICPSKGA